MTMQKPLILHGKLKSRNSSIAAFSIEFIFQVLEA
jgi:hypothetical protein